jgi:methionine-rich copper-binding protein CopC
MTMLRHLGRRFARRACGLLGALILAGIALAVTAPAASAHATLLFTSPAADSAVPVPPGAITLTFNEQVTLAGTPVTLAGPGGREIALGAARESGGRSVVSVPVRGRLPDGVYTVSWQVISADGDLVGSQYEFAVGPAPASLGSAAPVAPSTPGQWPLAVARWLLFAGLAAALGGLAGRALAGLYRDPPVRLPGPWALRGSLLGLAAGVVLAALQLGGGSLTAGLAHLSVPRLLSSGPGVIVFAEVASFAVAAVLLRLRRPAWAVLPLLAVVAAEGLRAHPGNVAGAGGALPLPPPASGPVAPLGGRAGQVGIYGTASAGQIVLHQAIPQENGTEAPRFTASMTLAGPRGTASALPVRGCGQGCFVAPARWARGANLLTLAVTAAGWTGGTTSLDVSWPPAAGEPLLRQALAAMRQVRKMLVYEQVTSDTALGAGITDSIGVSGSQFLAVEPYAGGVAPVADLVTRRGGQQALLLARPGGHRGGRSVTDAALTGNPAQHGRAWMTRLS